MIPAPFTYRWRVRLSDEVTSLVLLADTHCGSRLSVAPSGVEFEGGTLCGLSESSKALHDYWNMCWDEYLPLYHEEGELAVIHVGDVVDGSKYPSQLYSPDEVDQVELATELLRPIVEMADSFHLIRGTDAHDGKEGCAAENVAARLGLRRRHGIRCPYVLDLHWRGLQIHLAHQRSAGGMYKHRALEQEMKLTRETSPKVDIIVRAHAHTFVYNRDRQGHAIGLPAWKIPGPHLHQGSLKNVVPDIGMVLLTLDEEDGLHVVPFVDTLGC